MQENKFRQRQGSEMKLPSTIHGLRSISDNRCTADRSLLALMSFLFVILSLLFGTDMAFADPLADIKRTYSEIQTVEARFHQKLFVMTMKKEREFGGEFLYKRSKGFLWRYKTPKERVFLYDGKSVWQAEEDKTFVIKERVNKGRMEGNFLDLIEDISKIDQLFTVKGTSQDGDCTILELIPKKEGTLRSARIWTGSAHMITKMELVEVTGNTNIVTFSSLKVNGPVNDSLFQFKPGKKEVVEQ